MKIRSETGYGRHIPFDSSLLLSANTTYGIDVGMTSSTSGWQTGIPYINRTADEYTGGTRYMSGTAGLGIGDHTMNHVSGDMVFHLDLIYPLNPSPGNGATVPAGNVYSADILAYWRSIEQSPISQGYHYNRNAETFLLVGDAIGRAMIKLCEAFSVDAGPDMITWSGQPVVLDATVEEGVTVVSYAWSAESPDPEKYYCRIRF